MPADSSKSHNVPQPSSSFHAQLLRDIEANPLLSCKDLCNRRPQVYGTASSSLCRSVQNKFRYLKGLKASRPDQYWKVYTKATAFSSYSQDQELNQDEEQEEEQEEPAAQSHHASWRSPKPSLRNQ
jgi:hypothetical protein